MLYGQKLADPALMRIGLNSVRPLQVVPIQFAMEMPVIARFLVASLLVILGDVAVAQGAPVDQRMIHAMCAAANAILSTKMEPGMMADYIKAEATRHSDAARKLGATTSDLRQFVEAMAAAYNQKSMSWAEIADMGHDCTKK